MGKRDLLRWAGMGAADEVMSERLHCDGTMDGIGGGGEIGGKLGVNTGPQPRFMSPTIICPKSKSPLRMLLGPVETALRAV